MTHRILKIASAIGVLALCGTTVSAQESILGRAEFEARCSVCHGDDAKGSGMVGELFTVKPKDLTLLAKENGGVYPFERVYNAINGTREIPGHGRSEMPVWGDYFMEDLKADRPSTYGHDAAQVVQGRILSLVYFLQSLQE